METLTTDGPPRLCDNPGNDLAPEAARPPFARSARPASMPNAAGSSRPVAGVLPFVDRLAIGLTVFAAVGLLVGAQNANPSHSRELAPIIVTVPMR